MTKNSKSFTWKHGSEVKKTETNYLELSAKKMDKKNRSHYLRRDSALKDNRLWTKINSAIFQTKILKRNLNAAIQKIKSKLSPKYNQVILN